MARSRARRHVTPRISFWPWMFLLLSYTRPTITLCFVLIYTVSYTCFFTRTDSSIHHMHELFSHSCRNIVLFHLHFLEISKVVLFMYIIEVTICMVQSLINFVCFWQLESIMQAASVKNEAGLLQFHLTGRFLFNSVVLQIFNRRWTCSCFTWNGGQFS